MSKNSLMFQKQFKDVFLEICKENVVQLRDFIENDEVWNSILDTRDKIYQDIPEEDEAILTAIDTRKYKIFKTIDWSMVKSELEDDSASEDGTQSTTELSETEMDAGGD